MYNSESSFFNAIIILFTQVKNESNSLLKHTIRIFIECCLFLGNAENTDIIIIILIVINFQENVIEKLFTGFHFH